MSLANRHVVVTGGGSGVGAATALILAEAGGAVTILGRRADALAAWLTNTMPSPAMSPT